MQYPPDNHSTNQVAPPRRRAAVAAWSLVGLAAVVASCTGGAATATAERSSDLPRPTDDATIFAVTDHGGMMPVDRSAAVQPRVVISADGTVHRPAPMIEIFPGPVIPEVETTILDDDDRTAVLAAIDEYADDLEELPTVHQGAADAAFSELIVRNDDKMIQASIPALVVDAGAGTGTTSAAPDAAAELVGEIEAIVDRSGRTWEVGSPAAVRITSIPYDEEADPGVGPAVEFPLDGAALAPTEGLGCLDLTGEDLAAFVDAVQGAEADASTPWMTQGRLFQFIVRPLYSHEAPCATGAAPVPAEPSPATVKPTTSTAKPPTTKNPTTEPPTTKPPTRAVADGAGCTPGVGALTDGRWFGFVTEVMDDAIDFDLACWFSGDNAVKAAAEDGEESPPPNDYHVRNVNPDQRTVRTGDDTSVTWYPSIGDPGSEVTTDYAEWVGADHDGVAVWITIRRGVIVDITEQWTP